MLNFLTLLSVWSFSTAAFAVPTEGTKDGGGGGAIVCLNPNNTIKSAKLVDLEEANFYDHYWINPEFKNLDSDSQIALVVSRLGAIDPSFSARLRSIVSLILQDHMSEVPKKVFPAPEDLSHGRVPPLDLGCQLMGAAVYSDKEERLYISSPIFAAFSETDRAALILHEALYVIQRYMPTPPSDSSNVRRLVGFLFSNNLKQSVLDAERARFQKSSPYRARGESELYSQVSSLFLEFRQEGFDRPLYLEPRSCSGSLKIVTYGKLGECTLIAENLYGVQGDHTRDLTSTQKIEREGYVSFAYTPRKDSDGGIDADHLKLSCEMGPKDYYHRGFEIYCGSEKIATVDAARTWKHAGITIFDKANYRDDFLKDFQIFKP